MIHPEDMEADSDDEEIIEEEQKIQRDDLRNPFWIEDKEVLNGPRGHLKMDEIDFWKGIYYIVLKVDDLNSDFYSII